MDYENQDSILATVKKMLGIDDSYSVFDMDVIVLINSALMSLHQLGVGPKDGFLITDYTQTWKQLLVNDVKLEAAKMYVYLKVKTTFDPPSSSFVQSAYEKQIQELEWRLNVQAESVEDFDFIHQDTGYSGGSNGSHTTTVSVEVGLEGESAVIGGQVPSESVKPAIQVPVAVTPASPTRDPVERAMADEPVSGIPQFEYAVNGENLQLFMPGFGG